MDQDVGLADAVLTQGHDLDLQQARLQAQALVPVLAEDQRLAVLDMKLRISRHFLVGEVGEDAVVVDDAVLENLDEGGALVLVRPLEHDRKVFLQRSEEHTSELQSLMRISYAGFCL